MIHLKINNCHFKVKYSKSRVNSHATSASVKNITENIEN